MRTLALVSLWLAACRAETSETSEATTTAEACTFAPKDVSLNWSPCSLVVGAGDGAAECATAELPLDHCAPDGATVDVAVKRVRTASPSVGNLWYLMGGPGGAGTEVLSSIAARLGGLSLDLYTLDHRGVGDSTRLLCPAQENPDSDGGTQLTANEVVPCGQHLRNKHGDDLQFFSTTQSAADLAAVLAEADRAKPSFVYGGSYGTYWALRYLQLFPDQADGVVLEGVAGPGFSFHDFHAGQDTTAHKILDLCGADPVCAARLGPDPWAEGIDTMAALKAGTHCPELAADDVGDVLVSMSYYGPVNALLPALVYRVRRCEPRDIAALDRAWDAWFGPAGGWTSLQLSHPTFVHIAASELWAPAAPDASALQSEVDACTVCGGTAPFLAAARETWPLYNPAPYDETIPQVGVPLLMLQGDLDPASPIEKNEWMATAWTARDRAYVAFPYAGHAVVGATPELGGGDCGSALLAAFIDDPGGQLDTSCAARTVPLDFDGDPALVEYYLGTTDAWDG